MFKYYFEIISKIVKTLLLGVVAFICCAVAIGTLMFSSTGNGLSFEKYPDYFTFILTFKGNVSTYIYGQFPEPEVAIIPEKKMNNKYESLSDNEKIVYDNILSVARKITDNGETSTTVHIPINKMEFDGINEAYSYLDKKEIINSTIKSLNFDNIYKALHQDYGYFMWWEYDMNWTISDANLKFDNNSLEGSSFCIEMEPAEPFMENNYHISKEWVYKIANFYDNAQIVAAETKNKTETETLDYFKKYILNAVSYDRESSDNMYRGIKDESLIFARSFMSVFDEDSNTNAICGGYSEAFQLLCDLSKKDFTCYTLNGTLSTYETYDSHTWNKVLLNNRYYVCDLTNSEQGTIGSNGELFMKPINDDSTYTVTTDLGINYFFTEIN